MKIGEDLIYDKTGTCLHGFVNLGDVTGVLIWRYGATCSAIQTIAAPVHENAEPEAYDLRGVADAYFRAHMSWCLSASQWHRKWPGSRG